jgi:alpha-1,2-mannosyltransferase
MLSPIRKGAIAADKLRADGECAAEVALETRLRRWECWAIVGLLMVPIVFGAITVTRGALLKRRMTDAGVYFRAAWALRTGADPYSIADNNGWTYTYPPTLAALLVPLADPPAGADRSWTLPYPVSLVIWYGLSLLALIYSLHWLAGAVEETALDPRVGLVPRGCQRWWQLRLWPALICLIAIGSTIGRGQTNLLLLLIFSGMLRSATRGQPLRAGLWLAAAAALKVFPILLIVYPLWRRDGRWLAGLALGLVLFLGVIPALVVGPARAVAVNRQFLETMILPQLGVGGSQAKVEELQKAVDNQSFMAVLHNVGHLDAVRHEHRIDPGPLACGVHWLLGGGLLLLTWLATRALPRNGGRDALVTLALLIGVILPASPVCHLHYFVLALPLVMILIGMALNESPRRRLAWWAWLLVGLYVLGNLIPRLPGFEVTRFLGLAQISHLGLWAVALGMAWRLGRRPPHYEPATNFATSLHPTATNPVPTTP